VAQDATPSKFAATRYCATTSGSGAKALFQRVRGMPTRIRQGFALTCLDDDDEGHPQARLTERNGVIYRSILIFDHIWIWLLACR
jgi:hypothetical protein